MAVRTPPESSARPFSRAPKAALKATHRIRHAVRRVHPAWFISLVLLLYIVYTRVATFTAIQPPALSPPFSELESLDNNDDGGGSDDNAHANAGLLQADSVVRARLAAAVNASVVGQEGELGNHFCVLQPTLSAGKSVWGDQEAREHIALRAFLRTFATTVVAGERERFRFSIYYGHDSDDKVFGEGRLRGVFEEEGRRILREAGWKEEAVRMVFTPLYGLHSRINAIWNVLAKDAYYDGCDFFFLSNDDMVFFTPGWVSRSRDSLAGIGSPVGHKRPCRWFGIVRFKDEWASWATFTFHVSTRMHLEIFGGVYYPVPYNSAHNDYWINLVYHGFGASKYRGEVKVRNRVEDVDYALAHQKDTTHVAPARYEYDKRGDARRYINEGRARVKAWLDKYKGTDRCLTPL